MGAGGGGPRRAAGRAGEHWTNARVVSLLVVPPPGYGRGDDHDRAWAPAVPTPDRPEPGPGRTARAVARAGRPALGDPERRVVAGGCSRRLRVGDEHRGR